MSQHDRVFGGWLDSLDGPRMGRRRNQPAQQPDRTQLTPEEVAAMWIYGDEYSRSGLSAIDWWKQLGDVRRQIVSDFVEQMQRAFASRT